MNSYLFLFIVGLILSLVLTPAVRKLGIRLDWVDRPDEIRKFHRYPVPSIGGVGIYLSVVLSLVPMYFLNTGVAEYVRGNIRNVLYVLALSGLMMLVGLWDDIKNISPWKKLAAQIFLAVLCWLAGFRILSVWGAQYVTLMEWMSLALTVLWIVLITNAFNLIDGMDGLAAGAALFSTVAMLVVSMSGQQTHSVIFLAGLAGAILGFLRYNFNPATIFLGDSGSLLLGFMLSLAAIIGSQKSTAAFSIAVPVVALGLPILDAFLTVTRRFVRGRPMLKADIGHIHHILINKGLPTRRAAILLYGICGMFGLFSLFFINPSGKTYAVVLAVLGSCIVFGIQKLRYSEFSVLRGHLSRGLQNQRRLLAAGFIMQRVIEEIRKAESLGALLSGIGGGMGELCFSRFEILFARENPPDTIGSNENWELVPDSSGCHILRWNSPCRCCTRVHGFHDAAGNTTERELRKKTLGMCAACTEYKTPILQKPELVSLTNLVSCREENCVRFSLPGDSGGGAREIRFYYPSRVSYPIGAIAVLSEGIGGEFGKALQRVLENGLSCRGVRSAAHVDLVAKEIAN